MRCGGCLRLLALIPCLLAAAVCSAQSLTSSLPSGQFVGTRVTWTVGGVAPGTSAYRLSVSRDGGGERIVYDFSSKTTFDWSPSGDGNYEIVAYIRNNTTGAYTRLSETFLVLPRVSDAPLVSATDHPLVAMYSAPSCPAGTGMRVHFATYFPVAKYFATDWRTCDGTHSMNFLLGGMLADSTYYVRHETRDAQGANPGYGPTLPYRSGPLPGNLVHMAPMRPIGSTISTAEGIVLVTPLQFAQDTRPVVPLATDLAGRVLWFYARDPAAKPQLWRPLVGGGFLVNFDTDRPGQGLREIDLAGNVLRETTATRISEQLLARGYPAITSIHHEARRLPNGYTAILGSMERFYQDVQGVQGQVNVLGDAVIVLDRNWQVAWFWSGYDHLDVQRAAVLGERCGSLPYNSAGCPPLVLVDGVNTLANDWMHSNSIAYSPADGNLIVSMRHQDWVIKIDYRDGAGTGAVVWRLGPEGDFTLMNGGTDPFPWFSHQHDASYYANDRIVLFDNGNTPCDRGLHACVSRGQAYLLDEANLRAGLVLNADLGVYAQAVGSAQVLSNGNFHFHAGMQPPIPPAQIPLAITRIVETSPGGTRVFGANLDAASYRSFRLRSLYVGQP